MAVNVFLLGCPGSGKSTAARVIESLVKDKGKINGWSAFHISDYQILYDLYKSGIEASKFEESEHDGFNVLDKTIYNTALENLKRSLLHYSYERMGNYVFLIEFARCDYLQSFKLLGPNLLMDSYFLFINADVDACLPRINARVINPSSIDDHFVSGFVLECYRQQCQEQYLRNTYSYLEEQGVARSRITIIDNSAKRSLRDFYAQLRTFVKDLMEKEGTGDQLSDDMDTSSEDREMEAREQQEESIHLLV